MGEPGSPKCVGFLSDYGVKDACVGVCHAVIRSIAPGVEIINITHGVPRQNVRAGAISLADVAPYTPRDTVMVAVVDPGVGHDRHALAIAAADGRVFVGPDNGLLTRAVLRCGGAVAAYEIGDSDFCLHPVSNTFHGRDIFAPVAAHLAAGVPLDEIGSAFDPADAITLDFPGPYDEGNALVVHVIEIDGYGNVRFDAPGAALRRAHRDATRRVTLEVGGEHSTVTFGPTFAVVKAQEPLLFEDSTGSLSLAVNLGSASRRFGLKLDSTVRIVDS